MVVFGQYVSLCVRLFLILGGLLVWDLLSRDVKISHKPTTNYTSRGYKNFTLA